MTFNEALAEVVNESLSAGVPAEQIAFTLDMMALELKQRLLANAMGAAPRGIIVPTPTILEGGQC